MTPDRYEAWLGGHRQLSGTIEKRGSKMGISSGAGFVFGGAFMAWGAAIVLLGAKVLPIDPVSVHAPYWVLTMAGASFALVGFLIWGMARKQLAADSKRSQAIRKFPNEPALADYHWDPDGFEVSEWAGARKATAAAFGLTIFLSIFNWLAFGANGDVMVKAIVGLLDLFALLMWCQVVQEMGQAFRFGHSRILFTRFPYVIAAPVIIRWQPCSGINQVRKGTFTLRCVEEYTIAYGTRKNRNLELVHEEIWCGTWHLEKAANFQLKDEVELQFELPVNARPTQLSADKPVFWELEVKLNLPGVDFNQSYLVPIYGSKATPRIEPRSR